mgnify:CR=1 FL=1
MLNCVWEWYRLPEFIIQCTEKVYSPSLTVADSINLSTQSMVGMLFMLASAILGIVIVELLYNKLDWYLDPLVERVKKRYEYVQSRKATHL